MESQFGDDRPAAGGRLSPISRFSNFIVCCLLALATAGPQVARADSALDDYNLAVALHNEKRWTLAAESFRKFLRENPTHARVPHARLYLGLTLVNLEEYADARETLRGFVREYPRNRNLADAMYRVAECSYFLDDLKEAEAEFAAFLKRYPEHDLVEWALPYLADAQLRQRKAEAAADNFRKSLELFPEGRMTEDSKFGLARAYEALEQYPQAVELYRQLAADPTAARAPQAQLNLAARHFDAGEYHEAVKTYLQLEERFPESPLVPAARLNAGYAYHQLGDYRNAIDQFEQAAEDEELSVTATYWKGISHKSLQEYAEAVDALKATLEADEEGALSEHSLYHWADCELRAGRDEVAGELFLRLVEDHPEGELVADSLHLAGEAALRGGRLDEAEELLDRFSRRFSGHRLHLHHELLRGRLLDARGGEANQHAAIDHFQKVLDESTRPGTSSLARFHLARMFQKTGDHARVADITAPLVEQVKEEGAGSEFVDVLSLAATSLLALERYDEAAEAATHYLESHPEGEQAQQVLGLRAEAEFHRGEKERAQADLAALAEMRPDSSLLARQTHELAELAYDAEDWEWSARWFEALVELGPETAYHASGLSGLAWSQYQQEQFLEAAANFARLVQEHADDPELAPEAAYKRGQALRSADQLAEAADAYTEAFRQFAPNAPAPVDAEQQGPGKYAYLAGLEAARTLRTLAKLEEADAAYDELLERFPNVGNLDLLLDEWAVLHYEAENYERADELFRRLVDEFPESARADDARLNLAESDYIADRLDAAKEVFRQLASKPEADSSVRHRSLYNLVKIGVEERDWKTIRSTADEFQTQFPESDFPDLEDRAHVEFLLAEALMHLGDLEEARRTLQKLKAEPSPQALEAEWFPRLWILLAETNVRLKNYDDMAELVEEFRSRNPDSPLLHQADDILGRGYKNQAKFDEARAAFQRVIADPHGRRTETAAKSQFLLAETYMIQKDYGKAQPEYLKVYHLYNYPEWQAHALFQAAKCDEALGQWKDAVKAYEDLVEQFPDTDPATKAKSQLPNVRRKAAG